MFRDCYFAMSENWWANKTDPWWTNVSALNAFFAWVIWFAAWAFSIWLILYIIMTIVDRGFSRGCQRLYRDIIRDIFFDGIKELYYYLLGLDRYSYRHYFTMRGKKCPVTGHVFTINDKIARFYGSECE